MKLKYEVVFKDETLSIVDEPSFTVLTKKYLNRYIDMVDEIYNFDKQLSNHIKRPANNDVSLLREALVSLQQESLKCAESDDAYNYGFIWNHYIHNPLNIPLSIPPKLPYMIKDDKLIDCSSGKAIASFDDFDHRVCILKTSKDKYDDISKLSVCYGIVFKNNVTKYLYYDNAKNTLTDEQHAYYISLIKQLIEFEEQLTKIVGYSDELYDLDSLYDDLINQEVTTNEDKKYNRILKKIQKQLTMDDLLFFDEIWDD